MLSAFRFSFGVLFTFVLYEVKVVWWLLLLCLGVFPLVVQADKTDNISVVNIILVDLIFFSVIRLLAILVYYKFAKKITYFV